MSNLLVSVVIPTYNRAGVVGRAIDSVLEQTYRPLEIIVVDDGSTDGTADVLTAYGGGVICIRQENAGPSAARNRGIRESRGELIAFLDSDDVWLAAKLKRQVDLLQNAGPHVPCCLCNTLMKTPNAADRTSFDVARLKLAEPQGLWLNPAPVLATRFVLFNQVVVVRREALLRCGGYDERLWLMEDHDLALRLAFLGPWAIIREPLVVWCGANDGSNLSIAASGQPNRVYESIEYIDRKILDGQEVHDRKVKRYLERDLRTIRQRRAAARLAASNRALPRLAAKAMAGWDRLRQACFRRSPFYPRVEMAPIATEAPGRSKTSGSEPGS